VSASGQIDHRNTYAPVAQLDRVPPSEGGGRGFESRLVRHISLVISIFLKLKPIQLSGLPAPAQTSPCRPSDRDEHCPGHIFLAVFRAVPILCLYRAASPGGVPSLAGCTSTSSSRVAAYAQSSRASLSRIQKVSPYPTNVAPDPDRGETQQMRQLGIISWFGKTASAMLDT
jgi:hypothetical protein